MVAGLEARLERLEHQAGAVGGRFILTAGREIADADLWSFLAMEGVRQGHGDMLVHEVTGSGAIELVEMLAATLSHEDALGYL